MFHLGVYPQICIHVFVQIFKFRMLFIIVIVAKKLEISSKDLSFIYKKIYTVFIKNEINIFIFEMPQDIESTKAKMLDQCTHCLSQ